MGKRKDFFADGPFSIRLGKRSRRSRYDGRRGPKFRAQYAGYGVRPGFRMRNAAARLASVLGVERKYFDCGLAASALNAPSASATWGGLEHNPATLLCLNCPTQGTGATNRDGRLIKMDSLQVNGVVAFAPQADQVAADTQPVIKIWIVMDKQTNGGTGTGVDSENVYTNPIATAIGGLAPLRNMLYSKRYKVLKEITVDTRQLAITYDGTNMEQEGAQLPFSCYIDLKGKSCEYNGNAGTVGDIVTNGLFVLAATSSTQMTPLLTYNSRLRFRG